MSGFWTSTTWFPPTTITPDYGDYEGPYAPHYAAMRRMGEFMVPRAGSPDGFCAELQDAWQACIAELDCGTRTSSEARDRCERNRALYETFPFTLATDDGCPIGEQLLAVECVETLSPQTDCACGVP